MSYVTEVVVITALNEPGAIEFIDAKMSEQTRGQGLGQLASDGFGGANCVGCEVYGAGYDFLDQALFIETMQAAPWRFPGSVIAWIRSEADDTPDVWSPAHGYLARAVPRS